MGRKRKSRFDLPPRLYMHHGSYWYKPLYGKACNFGKDLAIAKQKWAGQEIREAEDGSLASLIDWYLSAVATKKAPRTYSDNVKEAVNLKNALGHIPYAELRPHHVAKYRDARAETAPVRANREKALLSHMFTKALERGMVDSNPCIGVKRNTEKKRARYIEDSEFNQVFNAAEKSVQRLMTLIYRTAQRPEDLLKMGPNHLQSVKTQHDELRVLRVTQGKTGVTVDIKLEGQLETLVDECLKEGAPYFVHTRAKKRYTYDGISAMFKRYVKAVGLANFGIYDLKGKAATDMYRTGIPLEKIQHLLGHSSITTTERYIKARLPDLVSPNVVEIQRG